MGFKNYIYSVTKFTAAFLTQKKQLLLCPKTKKSFHLKKSLLILFFGLVQGLSFSQTTDSLDLFSLDLEQLMKIKIVTASKDETSVNYAPSVVSVITAAEIQKRGLKSVKEVLDRVCGFFTAPEESTYLIANRGFTQNPNTSYLILLDGHSLNNQAYEGTEEQFLFPALYQVKQIEVIRGPGSTLWGSDAAMGIINIITYNPEELCGTGKKISVRSTADYEVNNRRYILNGIYSQKFNDQAGLMLSATHAYSDAPWTDIYQLGKTESVRTENQMNAYLAYNPSSEVHLKTNWKTLQLTARYFDFKHFETFYNSQHFYGVPGLKTEWQKNTQHGYIDLAFNPQLTEHLKLESNIYYDDFKIHFNTIRLVNSAPTIDKGWRDDKYKDYGGNALLKFNKNDNTLKFGVQYVQRDFRIAPIEYSSILPPGISDRKTGIETACGVFVEDEFKKWKKWILTLGVRYDYNNFRIPGQNFYPRFAAIFMPNKSFTFKYALNTGYVRTTLERTDGTIDNPTIRVNKAHIGPDKPQTAISNDFQINFQANQTNVSLTLYYYQIQNYIARLGYEPPGKYYGPYKIRYQNQNIGTLEGKGIELEVSQKIYRNFMVYGNYAFAYANFKELEVYLVDGSAKFNIVENMTYANPDKTTTGVPKHIWNAGIDFSFLNKFVGNIHYRGWANNSGKITTTNLFAEYAPEHFLDCSLTYSMLKQKFNLSVYGKNILNNEALFPQAPHGGYVIERNREFGLQLQVKI